MQEAPLALAAGVLCERSLKIIEDIRENPGDSKTLFIVHRTTSSKICITSRGTQSNMWKLGMSIN